MANYFTSDTHFGHRLMAILRGFAPADAKRDDVTPEMLEAHDESIVEVWNQTVAPDDTVWHLGDLTLQRPREIAGILARLNGTINMVLGNHDRAHPLHGRRAVPAQRELLDAGINYAATAARLTLPQGQPNRVPVVLSHFPYTGDHTEEDREVQWRLPNVGEVLLHGHTHDAEVVQLERAGHELVWDRQIHVGWDAWHRPVHEKEVVAIIRAKGRGWEAVNGR